MKIDLKILLAMIVSTLISTTPVMAQEIVKDAPEHSSFKSWMSYEVFGGSSDQNKLQENAQTDSNGLRTVDGRYCIAVGSYYSTTIGTKLDVELSTGKVLPCILGDVKADQHTDSTNRQSNTGNGNVIEFIVDTHALDPVAKQRGTIDVIPGFEGDVVSITVITQTTQEPILPAEEAPKEVVEVETCEEIENDEAVEDVQEVIQTSEEVTEEVSEEEVEEDDSNEEAQEYFPDITENTNFEIARVTTPLSGNQIAFNDLTGEGLTRSEILRREAEESISKYLSRH